MFITFEGIDFSGKSTQIRLLIERLQAVQQDTVLVREPGGTVLSERIRDMLLDREHGNMDEVTEFLLFSSSRSQLVREVILPALAAGKHVIADRFHDSSTAYQGYGRGLDLEDLRRVHHLATHGLSPHLTFLIDIPVAESFARRTQRSRGIDRMESASMEFYTRVRNGYASLADEHKKRIIRIDGLQSVETIAGVIWQITSTAMHLPGMDTERA